MRDRIVSLNTRPLAFLPHPPARFSVALTTNPCFDRMRWLQNSSISKATYPTLPWPLPELFQTSHLTSAWPGKSYLHLAAHYRLRNTSFRPGGYGTSVA